MTQYLSLVGFVHQRRAIRTIEWILSKGKVDLTRYGREENIRFLRDLRTGGGWISGGGASATDGPDDHHVTELPFSFPVSHSPKTSCLDCCLSPRFNSILLSSTVHVLSFSTVLIFASLYLTIPPPDDGFAWRGVRDDGVHPGHSSLGLRQVAIYSRRQRRWGKKWLQITPSTTLPA